MTTISTLSRRAFASAMLGAGIAANVAISPVRANGETTLFTVAGIPGQGLLQIRSAPSTSAPVVGVIRNGDHGFVIVKSCRNVRTKKPVAFARRGRPHVFCQVMAGDDGQFVGFVRGKYVQ